MLRIPAQTMVPNPRSKRKLNTKLNNEVFVNDKVVNRRIDPTLYNVESARATIDKTTRIVSSTHQKKVMRANPNQNLISRETLYAMNISVVDMPIDFSLLESNSEDVNILNPNIMDKNQFNLTLNKKVTAIDKFPNSNNPIYQLDEGNFSTAVYVKNKVGTVNVSNINLSKVVSDMNVINNLRNNLGRNKYFGS